MARESKPPPVAPAGAITRSSNPYAGLAVDERVERAVNDIRVEWGRAVGAFQMIGRALVDACHDGDEAAALAADADRNEVFDRIARSLSTMKGGPSRKSLSIARRVVAASKEVRGNFWDVVPYGHKAILVQLAHVPPKMLEGAQRSVEFGWTQQQTQDWVDTVNRTLGKSKQRRGRRLSSTRSALGGLIESVKRESLDRIAEDFAKLDAKDRRKVEEELDAAEKALQLLRKRLGSGGR